MTTKPETVTAPAGGAEPIAARTGLAMAWRWIFWINVPIGGAALVLATRVLADRGQRARRRLDLAGMLALGLGLFGVLWAMTKLATSSFNAELAGYLAGGLVLLVAFVFIERRQSEPMLDLGLFKIPMLAPSLGASFFQGLANFAVLFLVIMYLQGPRGLSPLHASLLLVPGYVGGSAVGPWAGRLAVAFTSGLHSAFYTSMFVMVIAAGLSASRGRPRRSRVE